MSGRILAKTLKDFIFIKNQTYSAARISFIQSKCYAVAAPKKGKKHVRADL